MIVAHALTFPHPTDTAMNETTATILLVEDNELNADMLSRRLVRRGYTVILATDGKAAVARARADQPDLILMDIGLPLLNGWEATSQIKADPQTAAIPIIALTARAMSSDRDHALQAGCEEYETKPIQFAHLLAKIEHLLALAPRRCT